MEFHGAPGPVGSGICTLLRAALDLGAVVKLEILGLTLHGYIV
jgi:hypothetical protein